MSKFPSFYLNIGAKATDVLYNGYAQQIPNLVQYKQLDCNFDLFLQFQEIVPGLGIYFRHITHDSTKVELQYLHGYAGINAGFALVAKPQKKGYIPILSLSSVLGSNTISAKASVDFDIVKKEVFGYDAGVSFTNPIYALSLTMNDKLDTLKASLYYSINRLTDTEIAIEIRHKFSINDAMLTVGFQHAPFSSLLMKARVNTSGGIGVLIQKMFWQRLFLTFSGETDISNTKNIPRIGMSLALKF